MGRINDIITVNYKFFFFQHNFMVFAMEVFFGFYLFSSLSLPLNQTQKITIQTAQKKKTIPQPGYFVWYTFSAREFGQN